eukprot:Skav226333  [mRNA]  locus=scaffold4486:141980:143035:+ [translate_table: standard]
MKAWSLAHLATPSDFAFHPEFDLVLRLHHALTPDQQLSKIKAHADLPSMTDLGSLYHHLGNQVANDTAIQTNKQAQPTFAQDLEDQAQEVLRAQESYKQVLQYFVELNRARAITTNQQHTARGHTHTFEEALHPVISLQQWRPLQYWQPTPVPEEAMQHLAACSWTEPIARATVKFFASCKWPTTTSGPGYSQIGISWIEIALGIMFHSECYFPVRRILADGQSHLVHGRTHFDLEQLGATLSEFGKSASHLTAQVQKLLPWKLLPEVPRSAVKSLYILGETCYCQGFRDRPSFDFQEEVITVCELYLKRGRRFPDMGFCRELEILESNWLWRSRHARSEMDKVPDVNGAT